MPTTPKAPKPRTTPGGEGSHSKQPRTTSHRTTGGAGEPRGRAMGYQPLGGEGRVRPHREYVFTCLSCAVNCLQRLRKNRTVPQLTEDSPNCSNFHYPNPATPHPSSPKLLPPQTSAQSRTRRPVFRSGRELYRNSMDSKLGGIRFGALWDSPIWAWCLRSSPAPDSSLPTPVTFGAS